MNNKQTDMSALKSRSVPRPPQTSWEKPSAPMDRENRSSFPKSTFETRILSRSRSLILLVALLCLLTSACAPAGSTSQNPARTPTSVPTRLVPVGPTSYPSFVDTDNYCTGESFCLPPQNARDVYGITPLLDKGFTGKGQTVIIIDSFGNPR